MGIWFGRCQRFRNSNIFCGNVTIKASWSALPSQLKGCTLPRYAIFLRKTLNQLCMCLETVVLPKPFGPPSLPQCLTLFSLVYTLLNGFDWTIASLILIPLQASDGTLFFLSVFELFGCIGMESYFGMREPKKLEAWSPF